MEQKEYKCICGKVCYSPASFNGHKSHCKQHQLLTYGEEHYHANREQVIKNGRSGAERLKNKASEKHINSLNDWLTEKHTCEKCGKVMTEKFGSGRFCSRSCANRHEHSGNTKYKIKNSVIEHNIIHGNVLKNKNEENYLNNPNYCLICGSVLGYVNRNRKTCSEKCYKILQGNNTKLSVERHNGNLNRKLSCSKTGNFKGIHCDSSWELAFVVYHIDHNIPILRNNQYFYYEYENRRLKYFPDFIVNDTLIEIKNYWTEQVQAKINCIPKDIKYKILYYNEIKPYLQYCQNTYGKNFWEILYT